MRAVSMAQPCSIRHLEMEDDHKCGRRWSSVLRKSGKKKWAIAILRSDPVYSFIVSQLFNYNTQGSMPCTSVPPRRICAQRPTGLLHGNGRDNVLPRPNYLTQHQLEASYGAK